MKFVTDRPLADPDAAARKLIELANAFEPVQDGRILPYRADQRPVPVSAQGHACGIQGWARACHYQRLALAPRERHLREVHRGGPGAVRLGGIQRLAAQAPLPGQHLRWWRGIGVAYG